MLWENYEKECYDYIKSILPSDITANYEGRSDSTRPDIVLKLGECFLFNVEIKMGHSQAGQFVLIFKDGNYLFSPRNKCKEDYCKEIIDYINKNINSYIQIEQNSIRVDCDKESMYKRIKNLYINEKKTLFFVTKILNEYIVFPTEVLDDYFDIFCNIRRKKSGSYSPPRKDLEKIKEYFDDYFHGESNQFELEETEGKTYIKCNIAKGFDNYRFKVKNEQATYILAYKQGTDLFEVRKLSSTNNINVIFELISKNNSCSRVSDFIALLSQYRKCNFDLPKEDS